MNFDFDFRSFQTEAQKRLARIYTESNDVFEDDEPTEIVDETYNKVQKILDCPEMEKSHPYLYSLDLENVSEDDQDKIDRIYDLGVQRGVLDDDPCDCGRGGNCCEDGCDDSSLCGGPDDALTDQLPTPQDHPEPPMSNFTVLYSGLKDGQVKTGEFYSQAADIESAKDDCMTQMTAAGYSGMRILAIEQNVCGVNTDVKEEPAGVDYYDVYKEDDSEDFEKQETGDTEDGTKKDDEDNSSDEDTEDTSNDSSDDNSEEEKTDSEDKSDGKDDSENSDSSDESDEESGDEKTDTEDAEEGDSSGDTSDDDKEDGDKEDDEEEELPAEQKALYKDEYEKLFKATLKKLKLGKSVQEMDISDKTKFWTEISKKWSKADPSKFLSDKEQEKLNKVVVKQDERIV